MNSLSIYAGGTITSTYHSQDEWNEPSLIADVSSVVHVQAGGAIKSPWLRLQAPVIQIDNAGKMDSSGLAPSLGLVDPGTGVDTPTAGTVLRLCIHSCNYAVSHVIIH